MNIAILQTPTFVLNLDYHGGIERVELIQLAGLRKRGHRVKLFVPGVIGTGEGIDVIRDWGWRSRIGKWKYYLDFILRTRGFDIRWGHYTPLLALLAPRGSVVHFHGLSISGLALYRHPWARRRYHRGHYVFCAKWVREEFGKLYPDIPKDHLHLLYNGVDVDRIKQADRKYHQGKLHICWYGLWEEEKGIYQLLEAIELLEKRRQDFVVEIGGAADYEGWTPQSMETDKRVRAWGQRLRTVNLVGRISYQLLSEFLGRQHLGIFPSIYRDPFPLVPIEMMAAGLPVVAYNYGGPAEAIRDGITGFLVENGRPDLLADRISWFLDNRDSAAEMGMRARRQVEDNFSLEKHLDGFLRICHLVRKQP